MNGYLKKYLNFEVLPNIVMHDSQAPSTISKKQWNSLYIKKLMNKPIPNSPIHNDVFVGDEN